MPHLHPAGQPPRADTTPLSDAEARIAAACGCCHTAPVTEQRGSRRRRIWELSRHAHCPVVGVCLPIAALRRLVDKVLGGQAVASDYELHCGVNAECGQRGPIAEGLQKELDRRYAAALRAAQAQKTSEALTGWWRAQTNGRDVPGALWATLTHPRCDAALEEQVLSDVHMIQHQNGSDALNAQLVRARAELLGRDTLIAALQEDQAALEAAVPSLRSRDELTRQVAQQIERIQDLERALLKNRHEAERERHRASEALAALHAMQSERVATADTASDASSEPATPSMLADRAVLCVGGRAASLPVYRRLVESVGGRFLHHDGGEEDKVTRLDTTLDSADLVICQTGCISHNAYWRVKDHCKRTGKHCLFVDNPSSASLRRALVELTPADTAS